MDLDKKSIACQCCREKIKAQKCLLSPANYFCLDEKVEEEEESDNGDKNTSLNMESLSLSDKSKASLQDQMVERWTLIRKALLSSVVGNK